MPLPGALSIYPGEEIKVRYIGSAAPASLKGLARVEHTLGWEQYTLSDYSVKSSTFTVDRTPQILVPDSPGDAGTGGPGCIVTGGGLYIEEATPALKRGQFYARLLLLRAGLEECLCCGYLYSGKPFVAIGEHIEPGPGGGNGFDSWITAASNEAGNVTTTVNLGVANAFRRYKGFVLYYNCAAVAATRTVQALFRAAGGAKPTGFGSDPDLWASLSLTLTTGEEGAMFLSQNGQYIATNDAGTIAVSNNTTAANPFPMDVDESAPEDLVFLAALGEATDVYSAFLRVEEWLVI